MQAWSLIETGQPLQRTESQTPEPTGTEVLIEVTHCGVCHSDISMVDGFYELGGGRKLSLKDRGMALPLVMGHEVVGRVAKLGPDAKGVKVGDLCLVFPWAGCGTCARCRSGRENMCLQPRTIGVLRSGGYGSHVMAVRPEHLIDISGIDPAVAATYACSGVTVYSAIKKVMPLEPDEPIVVVGAGGLGMNAIMTLKALGHRAIVVVDIDESKRKLAVEAGASATVDGTAEDLAGAIVAAAGRPVEAVIDLVNNSKTATAGAAALVKGGKLILVGLYGGSLSLDLPLVPLRAISVIGSYTGNLAEMKELIELARSGKLKALPVATRPHDHANEALAELRSGKVRGRLVLKV
jgi:alcohol dehydrogenase/propanol-preferring alcohol dehydrogenase